MHHESASMSSHSPSRVLPPSITSQAPGRILVVDDEPVQRKLMVKWLERDGFEVESVQSGRDCLHKLHEFAADVVLMDFHMPGMSGLETLTHVRRSHPFLPVIMITHEHAPQIIVEAMQHGAYDYLPKPVDRLRLKSIMTHAIAEFRLCVKDLERARDQESPNSYGPLVSQADSMKPIFRYMDRLSHANITVLIHGESGTGKELIAQAIHAQSPRCSHGEMIAVNCGAITASLQESLLFGHEKGAFTGAQAMHKGFIEQADGGTLFLDEVAELSPALQTSLLRVLQESQIQRVGGTRPIDVDIRVIAASHKSLREEVEAGRFREDLYYRLAIFELEVPPLRERREDIPLLIRHFLAQFSEQRAEPVLEIEDRALQALMSYDWPGNVRELRNTIERALLLTDTSTLAHEALPPQLRADASPSVTPQAEPADLRTQKGQPAASGHLFASDYVIPLSELERRAILHACKVTQGNMTRASSLLGISRATLYRKLNHYAIDLDESRDEE